MYVHIKVECIKEDFKEQHKTNRSEIQPVSTKNALFLSSKHPNFTSLRELSSSVTISVSVCPKV